MRLLCLLGFLFTAIVANAEPNLTESAWSALWIDVPNTPPQDYGVYHFRRAFTLPSKPDHFVVHVSGDNRYQLFVNGVRVSWGPARGDLTHWRYETADLATHLHAGKNVLAAVVWNDGKYRAIAQVTNQTGFLLQADDPAYATVNTGGAWKCIEDKAYTPHPIPPDQITGYYALGPNEQLNAKAYPWEWEQVNYDDSSWMPAQVINHGAGRDARDAPNRWMLVQSEIPLEEQKQEPDGVIREASGIARPEALPHSGSPLTVPPHTKASLLIDQRRLTTAFPELTVSGGAGAQIELHYAETLYIHKQSKNIPIDKGNRNVIDGKVFYGPYDIYLSDGGERRLYRPLYWRTYRYLRLDVETASQPLTIDDLRSTFTGYPFAEKAAFTTDDSNQNTEIQKILSAGWRTARLCAHETYMDCPFYEQLQYAGDARIQMMISLYMSGDARLMKNGIALLNSSRTAEGATYSRSPSYLQQYIPPFSLWWIGMVHDYWMYADDPAFVKQMLPGVRAVLEFYARYEKTNSLLGHMPWWNFVDWAKQWPNGEPPTNPDGSLSAALDLQLLLAYGWASDIEHALGNHALASQDETAASTLKQQILAEYWDQARGLFADQSPHATYSQQVNTLAVLAHVVNRDQARAVVERIFRDATLTQSSIYFRAYTNATLREVGLGGSYLDHLGPWREMLNDGLTTWAEWNGPDARSDCHAWGASPNFEMLRTMAGIESMAPGFQRVRIAPNPGTLKHITATMPHPKGEIHVDLQQQENGQITATVDLPSDTPGQLDWLSKSYPLQSGHNHLELTNNRQPGGAEGR